MSSPFLDVFMLIFDLFERHFGLIAKGQFIYELKDFLTRKGGDKC